MQAELPKPRLLPAGRIRNLRYLASYVPVAVVVVGNLTGGLWAWGYVMLILGVYPILELLAPQNRSNEHEDSWLPNAILYGHLLGQAAAMGSLFWGIHAGILEGWWLVGAVLGTGINSGSEAITCGHELLHRKNGVAQWGSKYLFASALNPYFYVAHVKVHHRLVGTPEDTTTARFGEALYPFIIRSVVGQSRDTLRYEAKRLGKEKAWAYGPRNYFVGSLLVFALVLAGLYAWLGWLGVVAWLAQGLVANFMLEYVNYIQHYGLVRDKLTRVGPEHAWLSNHQSRFSIVDLARHPDHHAHGAKHFHTLKSHDESPEMPTGYAGMIYLATVPPLWFMVMNPRVQALQGG